MTLTPQEIMGMARRDYVLGNTTIDEHVSFIEDQIADPFGSGSSDFFRKIRQEATKDRQDAICLQLFGKIEDCFTGLEFDFSECDQHLSTMFRAVYKLLICHATKNMKIFIREYIYSSKNRKVLLADHLNTKMPTYPKEQYGKKEFYILITKLPTIVKNIFEDDITLEDYLSYIERAGDTPLYFKELHTMLEKGYMIDEGIVNEMFKKFKKSDQFDQVMCKLQVAITRDLIDPYLEENGLMSLKTPPVEDPEPAEDDADDEEDSSSD